MDRMDQLPLPNLQVYSVFSGLAVFYAIVYALTAADTLSDTLSSDVWCTAVRSVCNGVPAVRYTLPHVKPPF